MDTPLSIARKRSSLVAFTLLAFAISWGFWVPSALAAKGLLAFPVPATLAGLLGAWGPSLAGIIMTAVDQGGSGLRTLFRRLVAWRVPARWYLFALLWPAALSLSVTGISLLFGGQAPDFANPPVVSQYPLPAEAFGAGFLVLLPMVFLIQFLFSSSMAEELGWRGYALPGLQARSSALASSAVLGLLWGLWHLPRIWVFGNPFPLADAWWLVVGLVLNAILYTWVFNNTRGSLLPVLLLHTAQAVTGLFLAQVPNAALETGLTALLVVLVVAAFGAERLSRTPAPAGEG